jgi:hypothetical protein
MRADPWNDDLRKIDRRSAPLLACLYHRTGRRKRRRFLVIPAMRDMISTSLDQPHFTVALHAGELDSLDVFNFLLAQLPQQFLLSEKLFAQIVRYRPAL